MKYYILFLIIIFSSCDQWKIDESLTLIEKVENIGISTFERIEYGRRGAFEHYWYHINDSISYFWSYSIEKNEFDLKTNPNFKYFSSLFQDPERYTSELRNQIQSLDVIMISQAPWYGNLIRFWISQSEFVSYLNPNFDFDSESKRIWQKELLSGKELKENWYYIRIENRK